MNRKLHVDLETFCDLDLRDVGVHVYVDHPSFAVTVMAWAFDDDPVKSLVWPLTKTLPTEVWAHIENGGEVHAHHSLFEHTILTEYWRAPASLEQMVCSMQRALVYGLPAGLGEAGRALNLAIVKDDSEKAFMKQMARKREQGLPWHEEYPDKLERLRVYCVADVEAERALGKEIPELTSHEREISLLDAQANQRGVVIDVATVATLMLAASQAGDKLDAEAQMLSGGVVTSPGTEGMKMRVWMAGYGFALGDLKKETVASALEVMTPPPSVRRMLEIRQLAAKSSLKKLTKMIACTGSDFRARGLLQYYGAGRTGRWAGRLIQVQNLPRPKHDPEVALLAIVAAGGVVPELVYGNRALDVVSSCLRACLVAAPGHELFSLDLSQIEARVLPWLAGQEDVLDAFRRGADIYTYAAAKQGSSNRQFGKVLVLACGYGMGGERFKETAATYGVEVSLGEASTAVVTWRKQNASIVNFWGALQLAAIAATGNPGTIFYVGQYVRMVVRGRVLKVEKPNGELLYYHNPRAVNGNAFVFDGVNQKTGKWCEQRMYGGRWAENLTQAVARDVLADAMLRVAAFLPTALLLSVHDEAVWELPWGSEVRGKVATKGLAGTIQTEFDKVPNWCPGLPIASEARLNARYGKG